MTADSVFPPDPYSWLEEDSEEVQRFEREHNAAAQGYFAEWPCTDQLRAALKRDGALARSRVPSAAGDTWFRIDRQGRVPHDVVVVSDTPYGEGRVIFDQDLGEGEEPARISWIVPSPDAETLALGVCLPGLEANTMRLVDVASAALLDGAPEQTLADNWTAGVQWLPDSTALLFHTPAGLHLHDRRDPAGPVTHDLPAPWQSGGMPGFVSVARDSGRLLAYEGLTTPRPTAVGTLSADLKVSWRPFSLGADAGLSGHQRGNLLYAMTDHDAPRGRVVAVDLDRDDAGDPATWTELLPPSDLVVRALFLVGGKLYVSALKDTYAWLGVLDPDTGALSEVELPGRGTVHEPGPFPATRLLPFGHPDEFLFMFSTFNARSGVYRHVPGQATVEELLEPARFETEMTVHDRTAISADGTAIPYQLLIRSDRELGTPLPAMVFGYGGFNISMPNTLPDGAATFVASGGIYIHAHLRGGGEYGLDWWRSARMATKQTTYDDLFAVAEDLVAGGFTTPELMAVMGGSNGGLLAGVAITQRPDLWAAAALRVPMLDLIASCRDPYGRMVIQSDFADPDNPEEVQRLRSISPYHLIADSTAYPAVFVQAGATDHRCPPWHARKFAARIEQAKKSDSPVILRVWEKAGHGLASDPAMTLEQDVEWLAFLMRELGMRPTDTGAG